MPYEMIKHFAEDTEKVFKKVCCNISLSIYKKYIMFSFSCICNIGFAVGTSIHPEVVCSF